MNLKLLIALLSAGILALLGGAAVVASLPSAPMAVEAAPGATTPMRVAEAASRVAKSEAHHNSSTSAKSAAGPGQRSGGTTGANRATTTTTTATTGTTSTSGTSGTSPGTAQPQSSPPSTAFVLVTITYDVKPGDTIASIARWFDQHGYGVQFAANEQVIESNRYLIVPGALISISNGVMTINSPL